MLMTVILLLKAGVLWRHRQEAWLWCVLECVYLLVISCHVMPLRRRLCRWVSSDQRPLSRVMCIRLVPDWSVHAMMLSIQYILGFPLASLFFHKTCQHHTAFNVVRVFSLHVRNIAVFDIIFLFVVNVEFASPYNVAIYYCCCRCRRRCRCRCCGSAVRRLLLSQLVNLFNGLRPSVIIHLRRLKSTS